MAWEPCEFCFNRCSHAKRRLSSRNLRTASDILCDKLYVTMVHSQRHKKNPHCDSSQPFAPHRISQIFWGTLSGAASPKIWGENIFWGGQNVWFLANSIICLEKRLSRHEMTIFSKHFGRHGPFAPPGYAYGYTHSSAECFVNNDMAKNFSWTKTNILHISVLETPTGTPYGQRFFRGLHTESRLRLTIRFMANGSLHTGSVGRIRVNFLGFDRLPAYLKLF